MSRLSRSEGVGRPSISGKKSLSQKSDRRFATRSEEFVAYMETLGYALPKNTKAEHFDYIFHDLETAKIAKQIMAEIKPENIVDPKELAIYEDLKAEGKVLYGTELERAFESRKALDVKKSRMKDANVVKAKELEQLLEKRREEIRQMKLINSKLDDVIRERQEEDVIRQSRAHFEENECQRLDKEISAKKQILADFTAQLQEKLETIHSNLTMGGANEKEKKDNKNISRLYHVDWTKVLENEDQLHSLVKTMFKTYTSELHKQEGADDTVNPLETEAMYRMFQQHENNLERLKHLIIYEKAREVEMDIEMAGCQAVVNNIDSIVEEARQLAKVESDIQSRMLRDIQSTNEGLSETLQREKTALIDTVREEEADRLTNEVREIFDVQTNDKKKMHEFYAFMVNILSHQRVRVDIVKEMIQVERTRDETLTRTLQEFRQKMSKLNDLEELLADTSVDKLRIDSELLSLFKRYEVPSSMLQNKMTVYEAVNFVKRQLEKDKFLQSLKEDKEYSSKLGCLFEKKQDLENLFGSIKQKTLTKDPLEETISELKGMHEQMQSELSYHEKNKERLAMESAAESSELLGTIRKTLKVEDVVEAEETNLMWFTVTDH